MYGTISWTCPNEGLIIEGGIPRLGTCPQMVISYKRGNPKSWDMPTNGD